MIARAHAGLAFKAAEQINSSPSSLSTGEALRSEGQVVRRRAGDAARNSPLLTNAIRQIRAGLMGIPIPILSDPEAQEWFDEWGLSVGFEHNHGSLGAVLGKLAQHLAEDGETVAQFIQTRQSRRRHPNGLLIQVWPQRLIDRDLGNVGGVIDGVKYRNGLPTAMLFRSKTSRPNEFQRPQVEIPMRQLWWGRYAPYADQTIGLATTHASIEADLQLTDFSQTAIVQQRMAACLQGVLIAERGGAIGPTRFRVGNATIEDAHGNTIEDMEPGTWAIAHNVKDVKFSRPDNSAFPHGEHKARIAAGVGMTREIIGGSIGEANFAAARFAFIQGQRTVDHFGVLMDWSGLQKQIELRWKRSELLSNRDWSDVRFTWLRQPRVAINPKQASEADEIDLRNGVVSRPQLIRGRGRKPADVDKERAEDPMMQESNEDRSQSVETPKLRAA